jgi:hypothetical protein
MSTEDEELEQASRSLLRGVDIAPALPADVRARAARRMAIALPLAGAAGGAVLGLATKGTWLARLLAARVPGWSLLATFLAGGALGAAVMTANHSATPPMHETIASVSSTQASAAAPTAVASAAPVVSAAPTAAPLTPSALPMVVAQPKPTAKASAESPLDAERALLDVARTALGRGDGANALRATEEHARKFPRGILSEEREAMTIQALRLLGRATDADARLEQFRARFPKSMLLPALEAK